MAHGSGVSSTFPTVSSLSPLLYLARLPADLSPYLGLGTAGWAGGQAGDLKGKGHARADGLKRALTAAEPTDEVLDWTNPSASGVVIQVLVRKSQGGAGKGMSRSLEGLRVRNQGMEVCAWNELDGLGDVGRTVVQAEKVETQEVRHVAAL
jgi:hypothetical protein